MQIVGANHFLHPPLPLFSLVHNSVLQFLNCEDPAFECF
uniref:Uncharacterized protein n=1 Tax=Arundo donax TaxID=35708 RepID=A0A0A8YY41_ARUDO